MTTSRTIVYSGQGYNLNSNGSPNPDDPIRYFDEKKGEVINVQLKKVRCKVLELFDNGYAVIQSNRSGTKYGIKLRK